MTVTLEEGVQIKNGIQNSKQVVSSFPDCHILTWFSFIAADG